MKTEVEAIRESCFEAYGERPIPPITYLHYLLESVITFVSLLLVRKIKLAVPRMSHQFGLFVVTFLGETVFIKRLNFCCRNHSRCQNYVFLRVWLLFVLTLWHPGTSRCTWSSCMLVATAASLFRSVFDRILAKIFLRMANIIQSCRIWLLLRRQALLYVFMLATGQPCLLLY